MFADGGGTGTTDETTKIKGEQTKADGNKRGCATKAEGSEAQKEEEVKGDKVTGHDALMKLRRLFTAGHWTRGSMHKVRDGKDLYCLVGGLRHVAGFEPSGFGHGDADAYSKASGALLAAMGDSGHYRSSDLVSFNDSRIDEKEVIALIDKALTKV